MLTTEISHEERIKEIQEQMYLSQVSSNKNRKNNRKNTRGRHTQYITEQIPGTFPPRFKTKCIKHKIVK